MDIFDRHYHRKYLDMQDRLYMLYDEIAAVEDSIDEAETRLSNIQQKKISGEQVYQFLLYFDKLYDKFADAEKKEFLDSFIERVELYEDELPNGRFLKRIVFHFPVFFDGQETSEIGWDSEATVECVALLTRK